MGRNTDNLLAKSGLWRASSIGQGIASNPSSSFPQLDQQLPGGGWPSDGITELLHDQYGIGEFRLILPALARLSQTQTRWVLLVNPPYIPYPPALVQAGVDLKRLMISQPEQTRDYLWVLEKALASQSCCAVIAWPGRIHYKQIRRLQVASKDGRCWGILFRPVQVADTASPADLRLRIRPREPYRDASAIEVKILKRRGDWESDDIVIHFSDQLHRLMPDFRDLILPSNPSSPVIDPPETIRPVIHEQIEA